MTELLVVMGIIALLASLLLPVLGRAKSKARSLTCQNHLRQLQLAWQMYAGDYNGNLVRNYHAFLRGAWRSTPGSWVLGNAEFDADAQGITEGELFDYVNHLKVYKCPEDRSEVFGRPGMPRFRSYGLAWYLNYFMGEDYDPTRSYAGNLRKESQIDRPSQYLSFIGVSPRSDGSGPWGTGTPNLDMDMNKAPYWASVPSDRHRGASNLGFVDGHVETKKWLSGPKDDIEMFSPVREQSDLQDLIWFLQHTPLWNWRP